MDYKKQINDLELSYLMVPPEKLKPGNHFRFYFSTKSSQPEYIFENRTLVYKHLDTKNTTIKYVRLTAKGKEETYIRSLVIWKYNYVFFIKPNPEELLAKYKNLVNFIEQFSRATLDPTQTTTHNLNKATTRFTKYSSFADFLAANSFP